MLIISRKFLFFLLLVVFFVFSFHSPVFSAQVVINEFLPNPTSSSSEWVEFYNPDHLDLTTYWLDDDTSFEDDSGTSGKKTLISLNTTNPDFPYLEFTSFLNNVGDWVVLFDGAGNIVDQYQYTHDPGGDVSIGRSPDGANNWVILTATSLGGSNPLLAPTSSPAPIISPSPTPTSLPTATYRINEARDKNGKVLTSVKIYVDGKYTHHYAPEVLTFGDDRFCDNDREVACGFGEHTIKLEKSGFKDWFETKTINLRDYYEANPVMESSQPTSSPTSIPSPTPVSTPTSTPTSKPNSIEPTLTDANSTGASFFSLEETETDEENGEILGETMEEKKDLIPFFFIGGGLALVAAALAFFKKDFLKEILKKKKGKKTEKIPVV